MSEELLHRAISAGVMVQTQAGHRCTVCDKDVTEIGPHLRGKDHQNNLAWEALSNSAPHQFLLEALPPVVCDAKQRSELELVDKTHFSYRCLVCTRRPLVNGIIPLATHLNGNEHTKAKKMRVVSPISPPALSPTQHPPLPPSTQPSNPCPTLASSNSNFPLYQPPRDQPSSLQQQQYPLTCNPPQYPSYNHPLKTPPSLPPTQSPTYPTHQPQLPPPQTHYFLSAEPSTSFESLPTTVLLAQPSASSAPYTSTAGAPHSNAPLRAAVPLEARGYDPELQRALTAGVMAEVPRVDGLPSFKCRACDKDFNGSTPCLEHLKSDKHKKKAQAWTLQPQTPTLQLQTQTEQPQTQTPQPQMQTPQPQTQTPQPQMWVPQPETKTPQPQASTPQSQTWTSQPQTWTPQPQTWTPQPQTWTSQPGPDIERQTPQDRWTRSLFDALPIVGKTNDQGDGSREFKWTVVTETRPFPPSALVYRNLSVPRGLVLIFNYFTGQGDHERLGAKLDSFNLKTLFDRMGYQVYLYEDYSKSQTEEALTSTQNNPCLKNYDSFIVFILSHGRDDQIFFTTSFNEEDSMKLDHVRNKFTDIACPHLHGKPKLFFVNFCRGRPEEQRTYYDGMGPHSPGPKNIVTLYSCINTFKSGRSVENGTYFVQAWCEVLAAHAHNEELRDLYDRVCQRLEEMNESVPELQIYFFKKFYFNPGR